MLYEYIIWQWWKVRRQKFTTPQSVAAEDSSIKCHEKRRSDGCWPARCGWIRLFKHPITRRYKSGKKTMQTWKWWDICPWHKLCQSVATHFTVAMLFSVRFRVWVQWDLQGESSKCSGGLNMAWNPGQKPLPHLFLLGHCRSAFPQDVGDMKNLEICKIDLPYCAVWNLLYSLLFCKPGEPLPTSPNITKDRWPGRLLEAELYVNRT